MLIKAARSLMHRGGPVKWPPYPPLPVNTSNGLEIYRFSPPAVW
jgi:hypothetical protein